MALLHSTKAAVVHALDIAKDLIPFPILGIDTDNGSEFINNDLINYCKHEKITFTRGRAYKKNDQCYVEQKNGVVVRQLVGYDRFEGILESLQNALWQHVISEIPYPSLQTAGIKKELNIPFNDSAYDLVSNRIEETNDNILIVPQGIRKKRQYRKSKKPRVKHWWRTRKDPFENV